MTDEDRARIVERLRSLVLHYTAESNRAYQAGKTVRSMSLDARADAYDHAAGIVAGLE